MMKNSKFAMMAEIWRYMKNRKKFWLAPLLIIFLLFGLLIVFTEGSALAPFIYSLF